MASLPPPADGSDRYARLRLLGEGAMGRVWLARDGVLGRDVALKEPKGGSTSAAALRLQREARVLARLDHPGVVALLDQGELADGRPFFVMRQASGPDLARWSQGEEGLAPSWLRRAWTFRGVVAAVAHAHEQGVVHRDLKPANVRVDVDGTVCVLDWGLGRLLDEPSGVVSGDGASDERRALTRVGARIGTPAWMSPEQAAGEEVGPEADVWALGVMFWEVLAGQRAYQGRAASEVLAGVLSGPPEDLRTVEPGVPEALAVVVHQALQPRAARPQTAGALLEALDAALARLEQPASPARQPGIWPLIAALVAMLALGLGWWAQSQPVDPAPEAVGPRLIEALLAAGDRVAAEAAACAQLGVDPHDPVARGALLTALPAIELLWTQDAPRCDIGEVLRWDGRLLACASSGRLTLYEIDEDSIQERWSRDEEVHQIVYTGRDGLLAQAPRSALPRRLRVADGRPVDVISGLLKPAVLVESRANNIGRGFEGTRSLKETWVNEGDRLDRNSRGVFTDELVVDEAPLQVLVLEDGREIWLTGDAVVRRDFSGALSERWAIDPGEGRAARMAVSSLEGHVLVLTGRGRTAVLDLSTGAWSPWAESDLAGAYNLAVSPDGRTAAGSRLERVLVWSTAAPSAWQTLEQPGSSVAFLDDRTLAVLGLSTVAMYRLPEGLGDSVHRGDGRIRGLVWTELGLLGWWPGGGRLWGADGRSQDMGVISSAAAHPDGSAFAVARGADGLELWTRAGHRVLDAPACDRIAWPKGDTVVCLTTDDGPHRIDVATGAVDRSASIPLQRWVWLDAQGGHTVLMDWDTRFYELDDDGLHHRTTAAWANKATLAEDGEVLLLNGRWGLVARRWRTDRAGAGDELRVPVHFRSGAFELSPDGSRVATVLPAGGLRVDRIDPAGVELMATAGRPRSGALAWSPDGQRLAVGDISGLVRVFDLQRSPCTSPPGAAWGDTPAL